MLEIGLMITGVVVVGFFLFLGSLRGLLYNCAPNEVLIFTGKRRRVGNRSYGYRIIKGGMGWRWPLLERVDRMDLTNMVIDIVATNAYSKGGIPLAVQGVANAKIAGHEPLLNNAIERFLGKSRDQVMQIAKATLEGSVRGILATMTPEQVNEDKILFAERLVQEVEQDMTALGLVVDTMKIQNVSDEVNYLDSIGRKRNAEVVSKARIAEAIAHADSVVRSAENLEKEAKAQTGAQVSIAKAEAGKRLLEITTRRAALVAEELAQVKAAVAKARADLGVQTARLEQVRLQLDADVIQPAKAAAESAEAAAKAEIAPILEDGKARAEALTKVARSLKQAGRHGKDMLLLQKLPQIVDALTQVVAETKIEKVTIIDSGGGGGSAPARALSALEQVKQLFGIDLVEKLQEFAPSGRAKQLGTVSTRAPYETSNPQSDGSDGAEPAEPPEEQPKRRDRKAPRAEPPPKPAELRFDLPTEN